MHPSHNPRTEMETPLNITRTADALQDSWSKIRADVLSHLIIGSALLFLFDVTLPDHFLLDLRSDDFSKKQFLAFMERSELVPLMSVLAVFMVFIYGLLLRFLGKYSVLLHVALCPPKIDSLLPLHPKYVSALSFIATTMNTTEFSSLHFISFYNELLTKYSSLESKEYKKFMKSMENLQHGSSILLGNTSIFLVIWIALFLFLPTDSNWRADNSENFVAVLLFLLVTVLWARLRLYRAIREIPVLSISFVAMMVRKDPDFEHLSGLDASYRSKVRKRIEFLQSEKQNSDRRPSFMNFVKSRFVHHLKKYAIPKVHLDLGWPLCEVYKTGMKFSFDSEQNQCYNGLWLKKYFAYCYYESHSSLLRIFWISWKGVLFLIRGAP